MRRAYSNKCITFLMAVCMVFGAASASAVTFPALELNPVSVSSNASGLTMTGSAPYILSDPINILLDLVPDLSFTLTSDASGVGTLKVDSGAALDATFSNLSIVYVPPFISGIPGSIQWNADLTYLGGSLVGGLSSGRVEGGFSATGLAAGSLLGVSFSASNGIAKVGAVVPVPAAAWLFGSGLLGLAGIARRKAQS